MTQESDDGQKQDDFLIEQGYFNSKFETEELEEHSVHSDDVQNEEEPVEDDEATL